MGRLKSTFWGSGCGGRVVGVGASLRLGECKPLAS